jgi:Lysyl oxidase/Secretion system C-terminal sorting domain
MKKSLLTIVTILLLSAPSVWAQPGISCVNPINIVGTGTYTTGPTTVNGTWYMFTADTSGSYTFSTCGISTCDTKIYIYDHCMGLIWGEDMIGTWGYNDDACALQSSCTVPFYQDSVYYIRIGDYQTACAGQNITWNMENNGVILGCTDPAACNYNPNATTSDGSCLYFPDTNCTGPDLMVVESAITSSLYFDQLSVTAADCRIDEGCLNGYGLRDVLRFTTHIKNIGAQDYFIGVPSLSNPQFSNTNCHGHWHYEGYAFYALYDDLGNEIPIGYKNGFCVLDLECSGGGTAQYSCGNMGISAGCGDIYSAGLDCQFVDLTNVDTGFYQLVVRVNWDQDPDYLGHYEESYTNNVAHACIHFTRDAMGIPDFSLVASCPIIYDCLNNPFGTAVLDCEGNCDGTAIRGDMNTDTLLTQPDAVIYVDELVNNTINQVTCTDMNGDTEWTVFDAALINNCVIQGPQNLNDPCDFPFGITNDIDTVTLSIQNVNFASNYLDIAIKNPSFKTLAYQFELSGITIQSVTNLVSPLEYNITPSYVTGGNEVVGISYQEMLINTNASADQLCRVYWNSITDSVICISQIVDIVNENYEASIGVIGGGCVAVPSIAVQENGSTVALNIFPNPATDIIHVSMGLMQTEDVNLSVTDGLGRVVYSNIYKNVNNQTVQVDLGNLSNGVYNVTLQTNTGKVTKRIILN